MSNAISLISSMATRQILAELVEDYTKATGRRVVAEAVGGVDAARRIGAGEPFDVAVLAHEALRKLVDEGFVVPDGVLAFASSPTAIAVRSGEARPTTCDAVAIKDMIAGARAIAVSTGPSGAQVRKLLQAWAVGDDVLRRIVQAPPGVPVARLLAAGDADLGFQQHSELLGEAGIDIVGVVPDDLLPLTVFSVGICGAAGDAAGARELAAFLVSPETGSVKRRHAMQPAGS